MNKLTVFYHCWIPDDLRAVHWYWWLDEQLKVIEKSGLHKLCNVNLHACLPMYWQSDARDMTFLSNGTDRKELLFYEKLEEFLAYRYPWTIRTFHDITPDHLYEGHTLIPLWEYSKSHLDEIVIYVHSKGICSSSPAVKMWRELLEQKFLTEWDDRIRDIDGHDVLGVKDSTVKMQDGTWSHLSGNFFWATTNYVATLQKPMSDNRYWYESWVLSENPKVNFILDTGVDHFLEYYPPQENT